MKTKYFLSAIVLLQSCASNISRTYNYKDIENRQYKININNRDDLDTLIITNSNGTLFRKKIKLETGKYFDLTYENVDSGICISGSLIKNQESEHRTTESILKTVKDSACKLQTYCKKGSKKRVVIKIGIEPSGNINTLILVKESLGNVEDVQNIIEEIGSWKFEKINSCRIDYVTIPFLFGK